MLPSGFLSWFGGGPGTLSASPGVAVLRLEKRASRSAARIMWASECDNSLTSSGHGSEL